MQITLSSGNFIFPFYLFLRSALTLFRRISNAVINQNTLHYLYGTAACLRDPSYAQLRVDPMQRCALVIC